jgi:histidinol-phosphate aminotransferase
MAARFDHARFVGVPLTADLQLDLPAMLQAIAQHRPKVVFLALPNNPTGGLWPDAAVQAILDAAPGLVVLDEAYQPFAGHSWMPRLPELPHAVVLRTVSKIGLAGLRFGYLAGHPDWIAEFDKVRPPYNLNVLTQAALRGCAPTANPWPTAWRPCRGSRCTAAPPTSYLRAFPASRAATPCILP